MPVQQVTELRESGGGDAILAQFCAGLQPLPSVLRYYDEFEDATRSIPAPTEENVFALFSHGRCLKVNFAQRNGYCSLILKHTLVMMFEQDISVASIASYFSRLHQLTDHDLIALLQTSPVEIGQLWAKLRAREMDSGGYILAKHILRLLCTYRWNGWSPEYRDFLRTTLPLPAVNKYAAIRNGDVFLSPDEEAAIVRYLDDMVTRLREGEHLPYPTLADTGMVLCAYQFAMRPVQIGFLDTRHVRVWHDGVEDDPTVHLTFHMAKQRGNTHRVQLTRRVKREWVPIFVHLKAHQDKTATDSSEKFFQVKSALEVSRRISSLVRQLIGSDDLGTATDLRHTAAQRLVDAGASHEELAEYMGHAHTNTGLIYYATSASHAERVNRALGASEVYRRISKIAHDRFISPEELAALKDQQQIAAVPHGMPISGIGGCNSGQPSCPYNPVTSCYGCRKFMPVTDMVLHNKVLDDMREVVLFFEHSSRADLRSPTYMQLQRTIGEIQAVIDELEGAGG